MNLISNEENQVETENMTHKMKPEMSETHIHTKMLEKIIPFCIMQKLMNDWLQV